MSKFLFLMSWVSGSDSGWWHETHVHSQNDLLTQFKAGNEHIFAVAIDAPNEDIAAALGYREAFHENYTAHDSISICVSIEHSFILPSHVKQVKVNL